MKRILSVVTELLFALTMYAIAAILFALALTPAVVLIFKTWFKVQSAGLLFKSFTVGLSLGCGFFIFGLTLVLFAGLFRCVFRLRLKEGNYRIPSAGAFKWAFVNSLYVIIQYTFIDFILLTPFANVLLRLMGAKMGKNVHINSKNIGDISLLELGDNSVVGGNATVICHSVEHGVLKLHKVKIGKNVTIGMNAIIMPGCEIGDNALIGAGAVLLKNTKIGPREIWYGVPAQNIRPKHEAEKG